MGYSMRAIRVVPNPFGRARTLGVSARRRTNWNRNSAEYPETAAARNASRDERSCGYSVAFLPRYFSQRTPAGHRTFKRYAFLGATGKEKKKEKRRGGWGERNGRKKERPPVVVTKGTSRRIGGTRVALRADVSLAGMRGGCAHSSKRRPVEIIHNNESHA